MRSYFLKQSQALSFKPGAPVLYAFDFDGTLAKIVASPLQARLTPKTRALLARLARTAPVAIITGRSVSDLKKRLHVPVPYLIGNHGLEGCVADRSLLAQAERHCRAWKRALVQAKLDPGVELEDKRYSLSIHYRLAKNRGATRRRIQEVLTALKPAPRIVGGKDVFNLVQPHAPHKGNALLKLMKKLKTSGAVFVGDDTTDEDVFALGKKNILTVRVGKKARSQARYYIDRQTEINRLLESLIEFNTRKS